MWPRIDLETGCDPNKSGSSSCPPGWISGPESTWLSSLPGSRSRTSDGRRQSTVSDSGDTGIGTYCSDGVEDDRSSSTTPKSLLAVSQHHLSQDENYDDDDDEGIPVGFVTPYSSSSPGTCFRTPASPRSTCHWSRSSHLNAAATSPVGEPSSPDIKNHRPARRCSSLTKLSSGADKSSPWTSICQYSTGAQGSLDRGLLHGYRRKSQSSKVDLYLPLSSSRICSSMLQRSPGACPGYRYNHSSRSTDLKTDPFPSSAHSSPAKQTNLDLNHAALSEARPSVGGRQVPGLSLSNQEDLPLVQNFDNLSPIQPAVRTQMWLTEQMEQKPRMEPESEAGQTSGSRTEGCGVDGLSPWRQEPGLNQMMGASLPVDILVKVKEGLLKQREVEINRQKLQILQLHARIRENELRAQQVLQNQRGLLDEPLSLNTEESVTRRACKQLSDRVCWDGTFGRKLAVAELDVLYLNKFFNQISQKYAEDIRKLEEKIKTRDRYITSLKKKCQRESEQNQEKQQRIETLEKYLSDLPSVEDVQVKLKQQEESHQKAEDLKKTLSRLQKNIEEGSALLKEKEHMTEIQRRREKELMASVHSLQQKVQQCLDDGVRLPVEDLKQLEEEQVQLLQQQDHSSRLLRLQREELDRLTSQLTASSMRLQKKRGSLLEKEETLSTSSRSFSQDPSRLSCQVRNSEVDQLLKEMSLCLLDLQGLCSILVQRAQGKQPSLSLLLGMDSFSVSAEKSESREEEEQEEEQEEELSLKLLEVSHLRRDINELRRNISERCAQYDSDIQLPLTHQRP